MKKVDDYITQLIIGLTALENKQFSTAAYSFLKLLYLGKIQGNDYYIGKSYKLLSKLFKSMKNYEAANEYLIKAMSILKEKSTQFVEAFAKGLQEYTTKNDISYDTAKNILLSILSKNELESYNLEEELKELQSLTDTHKIIIKIEPDGYIKGLSCNILDIEKRRLSIYISENVILDNLFFGEPEKVFVNKPFNEIFGYIVKIFENAITEEEKLFDGKIDIDSSFLTFPFLVLNDASDNDIQKFERINFKIEYKKMIFIKRTIHICFNNLTKEVEVDIDGKDIDFYPNLFKQITWKFINDFIFTLKNKL
jgi:tetratricopeptide (TPR) repeat protein